jgi:SAM-dependent methyltransferase
LPRTCNAARLRFGILRRLFFPTCSTLNTTTPQAQPAHVPETAFGKWFLRTQVWADHVLERALADLDPLIPSRRASYPVVIDIGVGCGRSLKKLDARFRPQRLIGMDVDRQMLEAATREAATEGLRAEFLNCSASKIALPDDSVDLLFCHQTFHHLVEQQAALREFFRVLKPGGVLLFAESTKRYIESWVIRLLFRHPMEVQKTAAEYLALVRAAGFDVPQTSVSYPFLWWSRWDAGIGEHWFGIRPPPHEKREETLINLAAVKPL